MTDIEAAIEAFSRSIHPSCWAVVDDALAKQKKKYKGQNIGWSADQFKYTEGLAEARAAMSILASLGYAVVKIEKRKPTP